MMSDSLQRAIHAIRLGDKETGKLLIAEIIRNDPRNETAWLWMSSVIDSDEHRRYCLERVLAVNPRNETAQRGLEALNQKQVAEPLPHENPREPAALPSVPVAADALSQIRRLEQEFTKKCPYCAETIKQEAVVCRFCGKDLAAQPGVIPVTAKTQATEVQTKKCPFCSEHIPPNAIVCRYCGRDLVKKPRPWYRKNLVMLFWFIFVGPLWAVLELSDADQKAWVKVVAVIYLLFLAYLLCNWLTTSQSYYGF